MIDVHRTHEFIAWLRSLRDERARDRIVARVVRLEAGLLGDAKFFDGIGELRIDILRHGDTVVVLLCGGDKRSQKRDIKAAKALAERYRP